MQWVRELLYLLALFQSIHLHLSYHKLCKHNYYAHFLCPTIYSGDTFQLHLPSMYDYEATIRRSQAD